MSSPYSAVFFDLGGTLFSYREVGRWTLSALVSCAKQLGVEELKVIERPGLGLGESCGQSLRHAGEAQVTHSREQLWVHSRSSKEYWVMGLMDSWLVSSRRVGFFASSCSVSRRKSL